MRLCAAPEALDDFSEAIERTTLQRGDIERDLDTRLYRVPTAQRDSLRSTIERRFARGRDRSLFGLMNAVTSVARDAGSNDTRWHLEELGGIIARYGSLPLALEDHMADGASLPGTISVV